MGIPLTRFTGVPVMPQGMVRLHVFVREFPEQAIEKVTFLIVDQLLSYNAIFGRLNLSQFHVVPSINHQLMKFPKIRGIG